MRSMMAIINLVVDGEITTKEQAAAIVDEEAREYAHFHGTTIQEQRAILLENIGYVTGYLSYKQADNIMELFQTQHPIFGKEHPTAEEAYRLGHEWGTRTKKERDKP